MRTVRHLIVLVLSVCTFSQAHAAVYDSGVAPQAQYPTKVSGVVPYDHIKSTSTENKFESCVLVHGVGLTQRLLDMLSKEGVLGNIPDLGKSDAALPNAVGSRGVTPTRLASLFYFGKYLINQLAGGLCTNIYVPFQESFQTSHHEMVVRTESFLRDVGCTGSSCAVIGHSLGGGVVTSIMRRCMSGESVPQSQRSLLGAPGCQALKHVFSAGGVLEGVGASAVLYGGKSLDKKEEGSDMEKFFMEKLAPAQIIEEGMRRVNLLKEAEQMLDIDILGDYEEGKTNPLWFSMSPITRVDDVPIGVAHKNLTPRKQGWFTGNYGALASNFDFSKDPKGEGLGCGTFDQPAPPRRPLLAGIAKTILEEAAPVDSPEKDQLGLLLNGARAPLITLQKRVCEEFKKQIGQFYDAQSNLGFMKGRSGLISFAQDNGFTDADGKVSYVGEALTPQKRVISDGLVDYEQALATCERGKLVKGASAAVTGCYTIPAVTHSALSGTALEAANVMIEDLSK